jgi:6,7-dimethyl-8-ribityllumazine synthase
MVCFYPTSAQEELQADSNSGSALRIGIVHARWNTKIIDALLEGTKKALKDAGVKDENVVVQSVPGSYELPYAVKQYVFSACALKESLGDLLQC